MNGARNDKSSVKKMMVLWVLIATDDTFITFTASFHYIHFVSSWLSLKQYFFYSIHLQITDKKKCTYDFNKCFERAIFLLNDLIHQVIKCSHCEYMWKTVTGCPCHLFTSWYLTDWRTMTVFMIMFWGVQVWDRLWFCEKYFFKSQPSLKQEIVYYSISLCQKLLSFSQVKHSWLHVLMFNIKLITCFYSTTTSFSYSGLFWKCVVSCVVHIL